MSAHAGRENRSMKPAENKSLEQAIESAIVLSWTDLMRGAQTGLIHVEYGFAPTGTLDYLKVLSSIGRGHWLVACEYWMSADTSHSIGIRFENGYESEGLACILEFLMQHQNSFTVPPNLGWQGLLQISTPSEGERAVAAISVNEAIHNSVSLLAQPALA
jgi:hypothetical protein